MAKKIDPLIRGDARLEQVMAQAIAFARSDIPAWCETTQAINAAVSGTDPEAKAAAKRALLESEQGVTNLFLLANLASEIVTARMLGRSVA